MTRGIECDAQNIDVEVNAQIFGDLCKAQIKNAALEYCKTMAAKRKTRLVEIKTELANVYKELSRSSDQEIIKVADDLKLQYEILTSVDAKGAQVRSKVRWIEEGEKNTKIFLLLEKANRIKKTILSLKGENGKNVTNVEEVIDMMFEYYKNLYKQDQHFDQNLFDDYAENLDLLKLDQGDVQICEGTLTIGECGQVLRKMKNDSSPGLDGLGASFYKCFWGKVGNLVIDSLNYAFHKGELSATQRKGVVVLTPKGNLPINDLKNVRPISLTCYKIGAAALAARIQAVIPKIVNLDQTAYIKGRSMFQNIKLIEDVIFYTNTRDLPGAIVALDFLKAFDSISKEYMLNILRKYNFGNEFIRWMEVFMSNTQSCVMNAGWLSDCF